MSFKNQSLAMIFHFIFIFFLRHGILEPLKQLSSQGSLNLEQSVILIDGICNSELHRPDHGKLYEI